MNQPVIELVFDAFAGLPLWIQVFFWVVLAIVITTFISSIGLFFLTIGARTRIRQLRRAAQSSGCAESNFLWVFVVPALNEAVTIRDSVSRLQQTSATHALFLVIDDASDDGTGTILAGIEDDRIRVLRRELPNARVGKAAALNDAYRYLRETVLTDPAMQHWGDGNTILCVVDADGRLSFDAPLHVAAHFHDPRVGGVQSLVHIYNQRTPLTWAQNVEFGSFGRLFQLGRTWWGTANMGGNGQFNRLAALVAVSDEEGPWRPRLTEDQDLGVRLLQAGWRGHQENRAVISQQGLNSLRKLYKQRVRWAQGGWQCLPLIRSTGSIRASVSGRIDAAYYLLLPMLQLINGTGFLLSILVAVFTSHGFLAYSPWIILFFLGLGLGPGILAQLTQSKRWYWIIPNLILVIPYTLYSWIIFPVVSAALLRNLMGITSWKKTGRETSDGRMAGETESATLTG